MNLIIVESPTKAKTISKFVGRDFTVKSSFGHVRDLPKTKLGIDVENNFTPKYQLIPKARKNVAELKKSTQKADKIILATDEDREGEAIAWHLIKALDIEKSKRKIGKVERIVFHEITKRAIENALKNPREIDMNLVDAQQARRILDRLVGYKLSPFLWKKIVRGLSAGRVQSVALRLIAEREREIENFKPEEYWEIVAELNEPESKEKLEAMLSKISGEVLPKLAVKNKEEAEKITDDIKNSRYIVLSVEEKENKKIPPPPFITSTLQQEAAKKLRFSSKQTMVIAQQLYEGVEIEGGTTGLITYMRTDSVNLSDQALKNAKGTILKLFGKDYYGFERKFKTKSRLAQEAHEAIRPTDALITPDTIKSYLEGNQFKLYDLIWRRFVASQMKEAVIDTLSVEIETEGEKTKKKYGFSARGQLIKFDGFLKVYPTKMEELQLPKVKENQELKLIKLNSSQHFTKPPARFNEASLIKTLEANGIGRPSTYAPIISTIQYRNYVQKDRGRAFHPTEIGITVNDLLVEHFPEIVDIKFTSRMENVLDDIAKGETDWVPIIKDFYEPFAQKLEQKYQVVQKPQPPEETDEVCEKCGKKMLIRLGRFGKFIGCSGFPECKNTKSLNDQNNQGAPSTQQVENEN